METKRPDTPRPPEEKMSPCPSCQSLTGYIRHAKPCNGCEDMICTNCRYGARYFCSLAIPPPSLPISRQCSTDKWIMAEEHLRSHPELTETIAEKVGHHVYLVRRTSTGEFVRIHQCVKDVEQE